MTAFVESHQVCLAPMMDRTDRHFRYLLRLVAPRTFLYTEMITSAALVNGDSQALLRHDPAEHPVAIQLGGSSPAELAVAAAMAERAGFDEINLNVGCPSDRVQAGCFGAALMLDAPLVGECVRAMKDATALPVTVKTRLGVDEHDSYELLGEFTRTVTEAGCDLLVVHARKAWLKGLSPKQNREIPPLDYARVHRLKRDFPSLPIVINGGIRTAAEASAALGPTDGVMIGRAACDNPLVLREIETALLGPIRLGPLQQGPMRPGSGRMSSSQADSARRGQPPADSPLPAANDYASLPDVLAAYADHAETEVQAGRPLRRVARHLMGLFVGRPGARSWRRFLGTLDDGPDGIGQLRARIDEMIATLPTNATPATSAASAIPAARPNSAASPTPTSAAWPTSATSRSAETSPTSATSPTAETSPTSAA